MLRSYYARFVPRLLQNWPRPIFIFLVADAILTVLLNGLASFGPPSLQTSKGSILNNLLGVVYLIVQIMSIAVLPFLVPRLRSGSQLLRVEVPTTQEEDEPKPITFKWFRILSIPALYIGAPMLWVYVLLTYSNLALSSNSGFNQSVSTNGLQSSVIGAIFIAALASLEEVWRWSWIVLILFLVSKCVRNFTDSRKMQVFAMVLGVVTSTLLFGMMHVGEYPGYGVVTWLVLSGSGILLWLVTAVTRRILVGMITHFLYDFVGIAALAIPSHGQIVLTVISLVFIGILFLYVGMFVHLYPWLRNTAGKNVEESM